MESITRNSLKKNFSWNFVGNLVYAATQWGLIIVFTRLGSVEMVGLFSLGLAITAPIITFFNLELRTVQSTVFISDYKFLDYFNVRLLTNAFFCISLCIFLVYSNYSLYSIIVIILIGISKVVESFSDITYGLFQNRERMEYISKSLVLRGIISLFVVTIILLLNGDLIISIIGLIISWILVLLLYDRKNVRHFINKQKPTFSCLNIKKIIIKSLPLGIAVMIVSLTVNFPKIIIEYQIDLEALGYFSSLLYIITIGNKFNVAVGQAILPRLSKLYRNADYFNFKKLLLYFVMISSLIGIIGLVISVYLGDTILNILYGPNFIPYQSLLVLLLLYGTLNYVSYALITGLNSIRSFKIQPILGAFWLLVTVTSSLFFIPKFGIEGGAYTLIAYSFSRIITIWIALSKSLKSL